MRTASKPGLGVVVVRPDWCLRLLITQFAPYIHLRLAYLAAMSPLGCSFHLHVPTCAHMYLHVRTVGIDTRGDQTAMSREARGDAYVPPPVGQERPELGLLQRKRKGAPGASSVPTAADISSMSTIAGASSTPTTIRTGLSAAGIQSVQLLRDQDPRHGSAIRTTIDRATESVTHTYEDGATTTFPGRSGF